MIDLENPDYWTLDYARHKLCGTFVEVKKDNTPFLVNTINQELIAGDGRQYFHLSGLNFTSFKLGYLLDGVYCFRIALREGWRQGLCRDNLLYKRNNLERMFRQDGLNDTLNHLNFLFKGEYPTFEEAVKMVKTGQKQEVPFNREFCVGKLNGVYHKTKLIGRIDQKNRVRLSRGKDYFRESLVEIGVEVF